MTTRDLTVLLVDDEPGFIEALAISLESRELTCLNARTVTEGIEILERTQVDVLVTDIMMPGGAKFPRVDAAEAGFHLIDYVQSHWPRIPIVCLSVIGDQARIRLLKRRGIRYLRKGETPLATAIEIILSIARGKGLRH
jgi:two-component system capsular synthesis response regulator RcsB